MKTISNNLAVHLASPNTTVAMLWKVTRPDGFILGFTDHDLPITFNDGTNTVTYAPNDALTGSATTTSSTDVSSQEVVGILDSAAITEADIFAGRYDYASIQVRIVNWKDLTMGALLWKNATLGQVKIQNGQFTAELRGLEFWLTLNIGEAYGPQCRADLGDAQCTVNLALWQQEGIVSTVTDLRTFVPTGVGSPYAQLTQVGSASPSTPAPSGWFVDGEVTWLTGNNAGFLMEVIGWDGTTISLFDNMPFPIEPGDTFTIRPGCDKNISTCFQKYNNVANHRGEPFIPGMDQITLYPNASGQVPVT
jgi:uncharacterized phage protein (TIGR02218 family)